MIKHIINFLLFTAAIFFISSMVSGIEVANITVAFWVAVVLGVVNVVLKPIFVFFTLPINILTLGLFTFVINAFLLMLVGWIVDGFSIDGFVSALIFSFLLSVVHFILDKIFKK